MRSHRCALAVLLAVLGLPAWAQVGDGSMPPMTSPPSVYSSSPPSVAIRPVAPMTPRPPAFDRPAGPAVAGPAAAPAAAPASVKSTAESREERRFLRDAAAQSRFELDASKLAFIKSANPAVRSLAASLINHHNTVVLELAHLLHSRGMAMPMTSNVQRKALTQLTKLTGTPFDSVYIQHVAMAQSAVAREYEKASAAIREPQVNAWIVRTLANTRFHQNLAERSLRAEPQVARSKGAPAKVAGAGGVQPVAASSNGRVNGSSSP